ncbi:MAG TPA: sugar phosphate isomerase/epimerase family protein [Amycolatopsis sp.]|uniref:sugar phosphate isomerase/epimerase family protein n=1 Tax=Amycolatopsis sp. TaxID=37632 RepID=UPI002B46DC97|nr:sugar phosphate isomerase/epimerase family protein [Amycolatopsis sp.]HKS47734.1 sugar phosphate isomerase/epimerase family protein [Amycolatopsis sp.]
MLSLNQKTVDSWSLPEAVRGCVRAGIGSIGVWREPLHEVGVARGAELIAEAGLRVSSLCRGGFFTTADDLDDNRRAIDEAATLNADCLVLVVGGLPPGSRDLAAARRRVAESIGELAPYARERSVRLSLEPMHPVYCADRGVLSTLRQALDLAEPFDPAVVGVVVDTFHVWWDPELEAQIARAAGRIAGFQVCDWITPLPADTLLARGMMGDGHIDFRHIRALVEKAGYTGDIEVEIFNADLWRRDPDEVLSLMARRFAEHV